MLKPYRKKRRKKRHGLAVELQKTKKPDRIKREACNFFGDIIQTRIIMKNILVGNGINIEFGGLEFSNKAIINRLLNILDTDASFAEEFCNNGVTNAELGFLFLKLHKLFQEMLQGQYDNYAQEKDEKKALSRVKKQYTETVPIDEIGLEDYFLILRLFLNKQNDIKEECRGVYDGLCFAILDAIYHNGKLNAIHEHIEPTRLVSLRNFFGQFDQIFTVNFDWNVEKISGKPIQYLHGDFRVLANQYDPNTRTGRVFHETCYNSPCHPNPVNETTKRHCYSNALLGFSGPFKQKVMAAFQAGNIATKAFLDSYRKGEITKEMIDLCRRNSPHDKDVQFSCKNVEIIIDNPELVDRDYLGSFEKIVGELSIIGMSPNNDDHIWKIIRGNENIDKII